jgi:hypothetical protein
MHNCFGSTTASAHFHELSDLSKPRKSAKLKRTMAKAGTGKDLLSSKEKDLADEAAAIFGNELPGVIIGAERGDGPPPIDPPGPGPNPRVSDR